MKFLALFTALFRFKKPLVTSVELSRPRWSFVENALFSAENYVVQAAKELTQCPFDEDSTRYAQTVGITNELIAIKKRLSALRTLANCNGEKA